VDVERERKRARDESLRYLLLYNGCPLPLEKKRTARRSSERAALFKDRRVLGRDDDAAARTSLSKDR